MSAPTPTCPPGSFYDTNFAQCNRGLGSWSLAGPPTCPSGYLYMIPNRCIKIPDTTVTPAPASDPATTSATQQQAIATATANAQASVDRYTLSFMSLQGQKDNLQKTTDLLTSAKGLYSGVSDDLHYSVNQFTEQIGDLQNEINITNRKTAAPTWWPWLDMFLNVMLVLVLLYAIYVLVSKLMYVRPVVPQIPYGY